MKINIIILLILGFVSSLSVSIGEASVEKSSGTIDYDWMDAIINKTPAEKTACPTLEIDNYRDGFKVARQKNYYGSVGKTGSKWFPNDQRWASVGLGVVANSFGIYFSEVKNLDNLTQERTKHLPDTATEISKWKVSDSAYWESQGGVSFYLGTGIVPYEIGLFTIATGGWANYLQKTGPTKVYVEMSKKYINAISFGISVGQSNLSIEKIKESTNGFAYQFNLDNQNNIEAFERFIAGDMTRAQELSKIDNSGIMKISNLSEERSGLSKSWGVALPFIPLLSFRSAKERAYDHSEENSVWDESVIKDQGIYVKQKNIRVIGNHLKETLSFIGSDISQTINGNKTENNLGHFKYSYQSDWGQEYLLREYIERVKTLTGLIDETCVKVPRISDSLAFNQIIMDVNWSDSYVKEIIGLGKSKGRVLKEIKKLALGYESIRRELGLCDIVLPGDENNDESCTLNSKSLIEDVFDNIADYSSNMRNSYQSNKKEFARNFAKIGEEVWKSPFVYKAFYQKGKSCGENFKFEVSGQRISRHEISINYPYLDSCVGTL